MPPDFLLAHARQELEGFPLSVLERYVSLTGLDATEYGLLVSILISLTGSSPPQDKLLTARALFVTTASGVPRNSIAIPSIWNTSPVSPWYQYAVLKTTPYPPPQLVRLKDWNSAMRAQAIDLDIRALAQKIKRYLDDAPNILQSVCRQEGLEVFKARRSGDQRRWIHGILPTRPLGKLQVRDHVEFKPDLKVFVGRKRTHQVADLEEEGPEAVRARFQEGGEHHDDDDGRDDQDKVSSSSTIFAHSKTIVKPDRPEEDMQQPRMASQLLVSQLFGSDNEDAQTPENKGVTPESSHRIKLATPTASATQEPTPLSPKERLPSIENSFMFAAPLPNIEIVDLTSDSPPSDAAEPFHEWKNVGEGSHLSETSKPTSSLIKEVIMIDDDSDDEVMHSHSNHLETIEEFPYAESPFSNSAQWTQDEDMLDANHQPREPSDNESREFSASDDNGLPNQRKVEIIVLDSDSVDDEDQFQLVKSADSTTQAVLHKAESPVSKTNEVSQYDGPHDTNKQPHELRIGVVLDLKRVYRGPKVSMKSVL